MQTKSYLLVIGIDKYNSSPNFPKLNNAVSDAKSLIKVLEERYNFQEQKYLFDEYATTQAITNALVELKHLQSGDNLIFFFSGHGTEDPDTHKGQLVPVNAKERADFISFSQIKNEFLECVKAKHVLVIFDCCFSGNFISKTKSEIINKSIDKISNNPSRYFLGSGGIEKVSDGKLGENSPFMKFLLEFLKQNTEQAFLTTKLALYVRQNVGNNAHQQPIYEPISIEGHCQGEFAFLLDEKYIQVEKSKIEEPLAEYVEVKEDFNNYLEDVGAKYFNSRKDEIILSDIFVEPYLKAINIENIKPKNVRYDRLWSIIDSRNKKNQIKLVITGSETSGKTTLCKRVFDRCYQEGFIPILLNGKDDIKEIRKDKFLNDIKKYSINNTKALVMKN